MILHFNYEEIQALKAGARAYLGHVGAPAISAVMAPSERRAQVEALLPRLSGGDLSLSTLDDLKTYHRMLEDTIATVKKAKEAGKSLEEIQAAGFSDEWKGWGSGFINDGVWGQIIYNSL